MKHRRLRRINHLCVKYLIHTQRNKKISSINFDSVLDLNTYNFLIRPLYWADNMLVQIIDVVSLQSIIFVHNYLQVVHKMYLLHHIHGGALHWLMNFTHNLNKKQVPTSHKLIIITMVGLQTLWTAQVICNCITSGIVIIINYDLSMKNTIREHIGRITYRNVMGRNILTQSRWWCSLLSFCIELSIFH